MCEWAALREKLEIQHMVIDATLADMGVNPLSVTHPISVTLSESSPF